MRSELPYALLRPVVAHKPTPGVEHVVHVDDLDDGLFLAELRVARVIAYDYETRGTQTWLPETSAVGVAFAWQPNDATKGVEYVYVHGPGPALAQLVLSVWREAADWGTPVCVYNSYFDSAITRMHLRRLGQWDASDGLQCTHDTYLLHRLLASEGWPGQSWSLKYAMVNLLGWNNTNEQGVEDWLLAHGHHTSGPPMEGGEDPAAHFVRLANWLEVNPKRRAPADRSKMHLVPPGILGPYACLDAVATVQLWDLVLRPVCEKFELVMPWHDQYSRLTDLLIDQQFRGIQVDRVKLAAFGLDCDTRSSEADRDLRHHADVWDVIQGWEEWKRAPLLEKEPSKFKKKKGGDEPNKRNKNGDTSKVWLKWKSYQDAEPEVSLSWTAWAARIKTIVGSADRKHRMYNFSTASGDHLRWLVYGTAGSKWASVEGAPVWGGLLEWEWGDEPDPVRKRRGTAWVTGRYGRVELDRTKTGGQLPIDDGMMAQLPDGIRELIQDGATARKEKQFVDTYMELSEFDGRIHAGWNIHGTKTGRLAGRDPNLQQLVKALGFLECLVADPGTVWVDCDFAALEPHILAECSRDPGLLALYGPDADPNHDRYLYSGAGYQTALGEKIRRFYDRAHPTKEGVARAKKECKLERELAKKICLASDYGAGWKKIYRSARAEGFAVTEDEAKRLWQGQRDVHAAVYDVLAPALEAEWATNGGWVLGLMGLPTSVWGERLRDLVNRIVQSGGHNCHILFVVLTEDHLVAAGVQHQWVVADWHDQLVVQVAAKDVAATEAAIVAAMADLNEGLGMLIQLKGEPAVSTDMGQLKLAEKWKEKHG